VGVALHDLNVEARVDERARGRLEGKEPTSRVLGVLFKGVTNGLEHSQLVLDIPKGSVRRAHSVRGTRENGFGVVFSF
jgi:hypothetical protein